MAAAYFSSFVDVTKSANIILWLAILLCSTIYFILNRKRTNIPGPVGIPFLGYIPFLGKDPHLTLIKLSEKYGSVYGLYLGNTYVVVITDFHIAKDLYNKRTALDRSPDAFHLLPGGVGFAELNGPEWVEQRRYTLMAMKDIGMGGSAWDKLVQSEVEDILKELEQQNSKPTNTDKLLASSMVNNILSLVSGDRLPMGDPGREILNEGVTSFEVLYDQSSIINFYPQLFRIAINLGILKTEGSVKAMEKMNEYVKLTIEKSKLSGANNFINTYLNEIESRKNIQNDSSFNEKNLIGNVQALLIAGMHTARISLTWLLYAMAAFPDIQDKVHKELDAELSEEEIPKWSDRVKLPYCHAVILEGQRWRTVAPLNVLHQARVETEIHGYVIPKNAQVIALLWAFHNDTRYWKDPEAFQPERFLKEDGKGIKEVDSFEPFSPGKRRCPGDVVALIEIFIYFTAIMHRFRILPEDEDTPMNLVGDLGLTLFPKAQSVRFVPRYK